MEIWHLALQPNLVKLFSRAVTEANFWVNNITDFLLKSFSEFVKELGKKNDFEKSM